MPFDNVHIERDGAIAIVTIDRRKVLNALDRATLDQLRRAVLELKHDETIRCLILTGAGEKAFVAGADIQELEQLAPSQAEAYALEGQHVFDLIEHLGKPVIAAVNGYALGGGCELAMACTLRLASEAARFGQPEVTLGVTPGFAGTQRLPRLVGKGRALDLLLTGRVIDAQEALAFGLVNRVVPAAELMTKAKELGSRLAALAPAAMRAIIEAVNRGPEMAFPDAAFLEAALFGLCFSTADMREGTRAFLEKRAAIFTGK
ncbi:MAG TPA: enoyl-CoA hydratase-related protein [Vicinamibacterales bacterium]|jgi:enoyl-CoA hydratase